MTSIALVQDVAQSDLVKQLRKTDIEVVAVFNPTQSAELLALPAVDAIVIDVETIDNALAAFFAAVAGKVNSPFILFSRQSNTDLIKQMHSLGIAAYIVAEPDPVRLETIIQVAQARFAHFQQLEGELSRLRQDLSNRKVIERAKGILMTQYNLTEDKAYTLLRKRAMEKSKKLVDVANTIVEAADFIKAL